MATKTTGWYCACSASVTASTATTATITVYCYWQNNGWKYNINNVSAWVYCNGNSYQVKNAGSIDADSSNTQKVSCGSHSFTVGKTTSTQSISCYAKITSASSYVSGTKTSSTVSVSVAAKTSYTVKYNANGGIGAPSSQTKWYGTTLTLSSAKPTRTGYTFKGWGTSASATTVSYAAGASYTANAAVTLYAIWTAKTYTVKYNANGGSGAPSNQTKTYGVSLTLSSTKPTRTNYTFKGWGTSASATTVAYAAGASYTTNASVTLYAIWELAYTKPRITGFTISRCNSSGTESDEGTYCLVKFSWATDKTVSSITAKYKLSSAADSAYTSTTISASGTSGSVSKVIGGGALSTENTYTIYVSVTDSGGTTYKTKTLSGMIFPIDAKSGGTGLAIGKPAELDGILELGWPGLFRKDVYIGSSNAWADGGSGVRLSKNGGIQIQRSSKTTNPHIDFFLFESTECDCQIIYFYSSKDLGFRYANTYQFDSSIHTTGNLVLCKNGFVDGSASVIQTYWADKARHNIIERSTDGLSAKLGWSGSSSYATIALIRGQTCKYQNSSGTTSLSDERLKKDFTTLDNWEAFYDSLEPCAFKMKTGNSGRYHIGFKAQQVEDALINNELTTSDFAGFVKTRYEKDDDAPEITEAYEEAGINPGDDEYGLIYTEFIALNTYKIQKLQKENAALKEKVDSLESRIAALEKLLT